MSNYDGNAAFLSLDKISGDTTKVILSVNFKNWLPSDDDKAMFWGIDGCFYLPIAYPSVSDGQNTYSKYLRIKIL